MKKFSYIALVALAAWGVTSCDEYTLPNPPAQSNEQEQEFKADDVAVTSVWSGDNVDLVTLGENTAMCTVSSTYMPAGYSAKVVAQLAKDSSFDPCATIPCFIGEDSVYYWANSAELDAAFKEIYGRNPEAKPVVVRYAVYMVNGSTEYRVGTPSTYFAVTSANMKPFGHTLIYPENYFATSADAWDLANAPLMTQTNPGDLYDNPDFYVEFATSTKDVEWRIVPKTQYKDDELDGYVPVEPGSMEGDIKWGTKNGIIAYPGQYRLNANFYDLTYNMRYNFEHLYVASAANTTDMMELPTDNRSYYRGVAVLANNFWLTGMTDNTAVGFSNAGNTEGDADFQGKLLYNDKASQTAMIVENRKALYMVIANIGDNNWSATKIKTLGAVGDFQGWDPSKAPTFTPSADFLTWTIKNLELNGNDFKICGNGGWGINFGGTPDNLVVDGGNFNNYGGAGKYDITLDFSSVPYKATITKQ